jgi:hypothetical protein
MIAKALAKYNIVAAYYYPVSKVVTKMQIAYAESPPGQELRKG